MPKVTLKPGLLLSMGNPLLDISANTEKDFLDKWGLKPNDAILAEERHLPLIQELVDNYEVDYIAGGSAQNTTRAAQWVLGEPKVCSFTGCIGTDNFGDILKSKAEEAGVSAHYQRHPSLPTGTCAVVVTGGGLDRSLCANLAAANAFDVERLSEPEFEDLISKAQYYYITGFFLTVSLPSILKVGARALEEKKLFVMNLSAPFICEFFLSQLQQALPFVDLLFGNETEALTLSKQLNFGTEKIEEIALQIAQLEKKGSKPRRVILTQGHLPIVMAYEGKVTTFPVERVEPSKIVDTNGAGDAFAGGFLAQLIQGKPIEDCIRCGIFSASTVVQQPGCTFPPQCTFT